jgi:CheY-like chemotaxis protein
MTTASRVLVVEDEEMMRELLSSLLSEAGYLVELADSGEACLRKIHDARPDLVLLDLAMPGMSGWEVLERLKESPSPPAVVVMSGMQAAGQRALSAVSHFVYGYLPKPFNAQELTRMCAFALAAASPSSDKKQFTDRRGNARRDLLVPGTLGSSAGVPLAIGRILNLSASGAMFDLGATLPTGKEISLAFEIPGGHGSFQVTGQITWIGDGKLGVRFTNVPAQEKTRLDALLGPAIG